MIWQIICALAVLIFVYGWFLEPRWLRVRQENILISKRQLSRPLRFLYISDVHCGRFSEFSVLKQQVELFSARHQKQPYDAILFGGDYIDRHPTFLGQWEELLSQWQKFQIPMYAVLGNHDTKAYNYHISPLREAMQKGGVTMLENTVATFTVGEDTVEIVGLQELQNSKTYWPQRIHERYTLYQSRAQHMSWYEEIPAGSVQNLRILLTHNPDGVYLPGRRRPEIVLAGHTHGGQFFFLDWWARWWNVIVPKAIPVGSFLTWAGRTHRAGSTLIVGRGMGGSTVPARLGRRPEGLEILLQPYTVPPRVVIGLAGKPHTGKDTVSALIESHFPGLPRADFSRLMRQEFDALHGSNLLGDEKEKLHRRHELTDFANAKRAEDPGYWIKKACADGPPLLLSALRLPTELVAVRELGGVRILITTSPRTQRKRLGEHYHSSMSAANESLLDGTLDWDYVIHNDGSYEALEAKVAAVCNDIKRKYGSA